METLVSSVRMSTFSWRCGYATSFDISHSSPTAKVVLCLGAALSLGYLSDFPGPPHFTNGGERTIYEVKSICWNATITRSSKVSLSRSGKG